MPEWTPISSRRFWWRRLRRLDHWDTLHECVRIIGWVVIFRRHDQLDGLRVGLFEWKRGRGWFRWTRW